jgi:hypothetical protein
MRGQTMAAILMTALAGLILPAESQARGRAVASGHVINSRHFFFVPHQHFFGQIVAFNSATGRFVVFGPNGGFNRLDFNRFDFSGFGSSQLVPSGSSAFFWPWGGFGDYGYAGAPANPPPVVVVAPPAAAAAPPRVVVSLPPCHEVTAGVAIDRGVGCSRTPQ